MTRVRCKGSPTHLFIFPLCVPAAPPIHRTLPLPEHLWAWSILLLGLWVCLTGLTSANLGLSLAMSRDGGNFKIWIQQEVIRSWGPHPLQRLAQFSQDPGCCKPCSLASSVSFPFLHRVVTQPGDTCQRPSRWSRLVWDFQPPQLWVKNTLSI